MNKISIDDLFTEKGMLKRDAFTNSKFKKIIDTVFDYTCYKKEKSNLKFASILYKYDIEELLCKHEDCNNRVFVNKGNLKKNDYCSNKCGSSSKVTIQKRKDTTLKRYGEDNPLKIKKFKQKQEKTLLKNYGVTNPLKSKTIMQKFNNTMLLKYGKPHALQIKYFKDKIDYQNNSNKILDLTEDNKNFIIQNFIINGKFMVNTFQKYYKCSSSTAYLTIKHFNIKYKKIGVSEKEIMIQKRFKDYNIIVNSKNIIGKELDIYFPDHNIAIEFNGIYWHQHKENSNKFRHQEKALLCKEKNIQLFHIYEDVNEYFLDIIQTIIQNNYYSKPIDDVIYIDLDYDNGLWLEETYEIVQIHEPTLIKNIKYPVYNSGIIEYKKKE